jgi:hypothetical protein
MAISKPLLREEVPEEFKDAFSYENQWQEPVPHQTGRHKNRLMVEVRCPICEQLRPVAVNDVRNYIRGVRKQMPIAHRKCKYPGKMVNADGYHFIWMPDHPNAMQRRYVGAHIYAMSEHLGRPIDTKNESVHHIDGDKSNNSIENLQLRTRYHGKGQARVCGDCGSTNILHQKI